MYENLKSSLNVRFLCSTRVLPGILTKSAILVAKLYISKAIIG
jgi:hypothetical protein